MKDGAFRKEEEGQSNVSENCIQLPQGDRFRYTYPKVHGGQVRQVTTPHLV